MCCLGTCVNSFPPILAMKLLFSASSCLNRQISHESYKSVLSNCYASIISTDQFEPAETSLRKTQCKPDWQVFAVAQHEQNRRSDQLTLDCHHQA